MITPILLEKLNWTALSCHDRALAIAAENLRPNSGVCFALFRMLGSDRFERYTEMRVGDDQYYAFLSQMTGIRIVRHFVDADNFSSCIQDHLNQGHLLVCATDNMYNPQSNYFGIKSHMHFVVIGPGAQQGAVQCVDEDWSKQYWNPDNCKNGIQYISTMRSMEELSTLCLHMRGCDSFFREEPTLKDRNVEYSVLYSLDTNQCNPLPVETIIRQYHTQLEDLLEHDVHHSQYLQNQYEVFYRNFDTMLDSMPQLTLETASGLLKNDPHGLKKYVYYPAELRCWLAHYQHLSAQYQIFVQQKHPSAQELAQELAQILEKYSIVQNSIIVAVVQKQRMLLAHAYHLFMQLYQMEVEISQRILRLI